ncbi:MAG: chemotaxis response regulator protein-glutamate methylesterase [Aquificota bacterium]|nr:chemotaxis response regulator protein-glutamate methylesterase [Aquificota bacterium]
MIRVLIVDDSPFVRLALRKILSGSEDIEVIGEASNGKEAIRLTQELRPDVITLDINMPIMDGLTALGEIRRVCPSCKVIMISALTKEGARETISALEKGAVDFITKPTDYQELFSFKEEIVRKIRAAFSTGLKREVSFKPPVRRRERAFKTHPLVTIGISTGGPQTLKVVLPSLPEDFPSPVIVAIHMPDTFTATFASYMDSLCKLPVREAQEGEVIRGGHIYISRGRIHLTLKGTPERAYVRYIQDDSHPFKPSADLLLASSAKVFGSDTIGVVMTGMGNDGAKGIVEVKKVGGVTVAEDPNSAILWAMPESAIKTGCVDYVVPKEEMANLLVKLVSKVSV